MECEYDPVEDRELLPAYPPPDGSFSTADTTAYPYFYHSSPPSCVDDARHIKEKENAQESQETAISDLSREKRLTSHQAAVDNAVGAGEWVHIGLASTTDNHTAPDVDLGYG